jgi:predicted tellurium resistance membrane protein TerC
MTLTSEDIVAFFTLCSLEVVLGIDNVIFIAILAGKLPEKERDKARLWGLSLAAGMRIVLLLGIGLVMMLKTPLITLPIGQDGLGLSGKDLILLFGGLFLIAKATYEIHHKIEAASEPEGSKPAAASLKIVLLQVLMVDLVFSLDSVITAVGMTNNVPVMVAVILVSVGVMLAFSGHIIAFIERHPAVKILALSFLILIGTLLVAEGVHRKDILPKGFVYFAMAFSFIVECLQIAASKKKKAEPAKS